MEKYYCMTMKYGINIYMDTNTDHYTLLTVRVRGKNNGRVQDTDQTRPNHTRPDQPHALIHTIPIKPHMCSVAAAVLPQDGASQAPLATDVSNDLSISKVRQYLTNSL